MKAKIIACCAIAVAMVVSPALAAGKKSAKRAAQPQQTATSTSPVGAAVGTAGAVAGGAVATAGAIATAPFNAAAMGPPSTINAPTCKPGDMVTINGQKMRCQ